MGKTSELDDVDYKILTILMKDASLSYADIGKEVFVSQGTVHVRVKKMEQLGVIVKTETRVDYSKIGFDIHAFLGIHLRESSLYDSVVEQLNKIPEILNIHYTTGSYAIFTKVICRDTKHLMSLLHDSIQKIEGIERTETFISLEESVNRPLDLMELEKFNTIKNKVKGKNH